MSQTKEQRRKWYLATREKNRERNKLRHKLWYEANKEHVSARNARWAAANPEKVKKYRDEYHAARAASGERQKYDALYRLRKYGLTQEAFDALLREQGGSCRICRTDSPGAKRGWNIDHDHATGRVRGILCHRCNAALGLLDDNAERAEACAAYLRRG